MITCTNHPQREADFHCARCEIAYCKDCVNEKMFGRTKTSVCPTCAEPVTDLGPYREVPPLWTRIHLALIWPVQGEGYILLLAWGMFSVVFLGGARFSLSVGGIFGYVGFAMCMVVYTGFLISYLYRIISKGETGDFQVPEFSEYRGMMETFIWPIVQYYLTFILIFWPIFVYFLGAMIFMGIEGLGRVIFSPITWAVFGLGIIYGLIFLPMGLLILGVGRSVMPLLNPLIYIREVFKIPGAYFITLAILLLFLIIYGVVSVFLLLIKMSLPDVSIIFGAVRAFIDGVVQLYVFMVFAHVLGYLAYQERFKLKWWPETKEKPSFMIAGRPQFMSTSRFPVYAPGGAGGATMPGSIGPPGAAPAGAAVAGAAAAGAASARGGYPPPPPGGSSSPGGQEYASNPPPDGMEISQRIADGMAMLDHGRHQEAEILFKEILDQNPNNMGALRGITLALLKQKNYPAAAEYARKQAAALLKDKAYEAAWEVYSEMGKHVKDFSLEPREQLSLAKWLNDRQMWMDAARVLRALAVRNPDDPLAPKALYQCGEMLWKKCDKKDNALQVFQYLLKKYPDIQFADHVNQAIKELQS